VQIEKLEYYIHYDLYILYFVLYVH